MEWADENQLLPLLKRELGLGERLLWAGQPDARPVFYKSFAIWLFAVPWTAFAVFWEFMALGGWLSDAAPRDAATLGAGIVMPIFGLPFVLIGIGMLSAPWLAARSMRRTIYGVSDRRLVSVSKGWSLKVRSAEIGKTGPITRAERANGCGSLVIETHSRIDSDGDRITDKFEFVEVEEVAKLEALIRRQIESLQLQG